MKIDEALYQLKQNIKMHEIEGTTSNQNEREKALLDYITNLQEKLDFMIDKNDEKQERIDKVIEYINKFWEKKSYYEDVDNCMKYVTMNEWDKSDLLNILQGEDKDE